MLRTIILLPDGAEISSGTGSTIAIQKSTITECVNGENELTIGSVCANQFKATIFAPEGQLNIDAGTEVSILKEDDSGQRYPVGRFILDKPTRTTANTFSVTGYDRVSKLDKDLTAWLSGLAGWPYSLNAFAIEVCKACGVPFKETDVPNKDFQIQKFTRTAVTGRQLMRWLGEICCSFCRADREGRIEFAWYKEADVEIRPTGDRYYFQNGLTFENYEVAKVDAVQIRLADSENGALWPTAAKGANSYIITGNPILNARISNDLLPYLQAIQNRLSNATYTPCKVEIPASMDIAAGDIIKIADKNGKSITTYVMTKTQTGQKDTLESTGSARRDSTAATNNKSQQDREAAMENYASAASGSAAKQALDNQTWQELFNKWTDGGKIQGVFAENGVWVINAAVAVIQNLVANLITAGVLQSKDGKTFYLDLDNGILKMSASEFSVRGKTVEGIAGEKAAEAEANAKDYADNAASNAVNSQTQQDIFNKLFDNGKVKGFAIVDGKLYVNGDYAEILNLVANNIVAGVLSSADGKTFFDLEKAEFVTTASDGTKVVIKNGNVSLFDENESKRVSVEKYGEHYSIRCLTPDGVVVTGMGASSYGGVLYAAADTSQGSGTVGLKPVWRTINGVTYLVGG